MGQAGPPPKVKLREASGDGVSPFSGDRLAGPIPGFALTRRRCRQSRGWRGKRETAEGGCSRDICEHLRRVTNRRLLDVKGAGLRVSRNTRRWVALR